MLTALAFLIGYFSLVALALARHPVWGLYAYLAAFYIHPPSRWWAQNLPDLRWAFLAAGVTLLAIVIQRDKLRSDRPAWHATVPGVLLIVLFLWMALQSLWALDAQRHVDAVIQYGKYILAFYFIYRIVDTPERIRDVLLVHVAGCAYLGLLAYFANNYVDGRLNGVGGPGINDANSLGMFLGTGAIVAAMLALVERGWRRMFVILAGAVICNGVILAASRGAFLGVLFGGLVLFLVKPPQYRRLFWAFAAVGVLGAVSLMDQRFIDRMFSIEAAVEQSEDMDGSAQSRWVLMQAQVRMFADHPMGVGHKGTAVLSPQYLDRRWLTRRWGEDESAAGRSSHNTFLTLLVEQSLPGVAVYLAFVLWGVAALLTLRRRLRTEAAVAHAYGGAALSALGVVLAAGMFTDYLMAEVQIWMTALLAAQLSLRSAEAAAKIAPAGTALQAAQRG